MYDVTSNVFFFFVCACVFLRYFFHTQQEQQQQQQQFLGSLLSCDQGLQKIFEDELTLLVPQSPFWGQTTRLFQWFAPDTGVTAILPREGLTCRSNAIHTTLWTQI